MKPSPEAYKRARIGASVYIATLLTLFGIHFVVSIPRFARLVVVIAVGFPLAWGAVSGIVRGAAARFAEGEAEGKPETLRVVVALRSRSQQVARAIDDRYTESGQLIRAECLWSSSSAQPDAWDVVVYDNDDVLSAVVIGDKAPRLIRFTPFRGRADNGAAKRSPDIDSSGGGHAKRGDADLVQIANLGQLADVLGVDFQRHGPRRARRLGMVSKIVAAVTITAAVGAFILLVIAVAYGFP